MMYKFPSLLLPHNLERMAKYMRLFGLVDTSREVCYKLRTDSQAMFDRAMPIMPVIYKSPVWSEELSNAPVMISVVIPVKDAGENFRPLLTILKNQRGFRAIEIVVVDSGSTDQSLAIAEACGAKLIQILPEDFSHSYARNLGAEHTSGDYVLFTVQDALPPSDVWLYELFKVTTDNDVVAVSCVEFPRPDADLFYKALAWNNYKFLEVDKQDRILCKPENENYITLRKNGNISDIACLIRRDIFMQYKFRGNYAEDLDMGIRLIRDGYKLALLSSTKIIHSHNRPAYYYLKRGYVDNVRMSSILPDRPVVAIEAKRLFHDLLWLYQVVHVIVVQELPQLTVPCTVKRLATVVMKKLSMAAGSTYPHGINVQCNEYIDSQFQSFLKHISCCYTAREENTALCDDILLGTMQSYTRMIFSYVSEAYKIIDDTILEEFKMCLCRTYAFICGIYLASCYARSAKNTQEDLEAIHSELSQGV